MRWYLLKTWAGREEELVNEVRRSVSTSSYKECFVIYQERIWRKQQRNIVQMKVLFPGCVFLTCETSEFTLQKIERIPAIARLIASGSLTILRMMEEDAAFLEKISGKKHIVKLSYVLKDENGNICKLSEPLNIFFGQIERMQFKKRYAMVRHQLWGEDRQFVLGIMFKEDMNQMVLEQEKSDGRYDLR